MPQKNSIRKTVSSRWFWSDFCDRAILRETDTASAAVLDSQARPHAARVLTTRATLPEFSLESPLFRAIVLRRLRLPLPLTSPK